MGTMRMIKVLDKNRTLVVKDTIVIPKDGSIKFVDYRGFVMVEFTDKGLLKLKDRMVKIWNRHSY